MRNSIHSVMLILCVWLYTSCTTTRRYISDNTVIQRDTIVNKIISRDSIFYHDSVYNLIKGDTVIIKEYHTRYIDRSIRDTIYISRKDSASNKIEVVKEKKRTILDWLENFGTSLAFSFLILIVFIIIYKKLNR